MSMGQKDAIDPYLCVIYLKKKKASVKERAEVSVQKFLHSRFFILYSKTQALKENNTRNV